MPPSALITGGAGYIGGHVALTLRERGWKTIVLDDLSTGSRDGISPDSVFERGDICDGDFVESVFAAHPVVAVLHLAAVASVPQSVAAPARCDKINRQGAAVVIDSARRRKIKFFVLSSTSAVYDENGAPPFAEDAPLHPISPYAASKLAAEQYLAAGKTPAFAVLRYFNVGGADKKLRAGNHKRADTTLIKSALECAAGRRPYLCLYGADYPTPDGTGIRDYIHVSDIARAHVSALAYLMSGGKSDIFNLGLGRGFSVREVIATAKKITGVNFPVKEMPRRPGDPATIYADATKARQVLGFEPEAKTLEQIIADAWAWERGHRG